METPQLLVLQATLSLAAYAAIGVCFVRPWLERKPRREALSILLLPQLFRHVGVSLVVPEVVDPTMPEAFARQTAVGDTIVVGLAWMAFVSLRARFRFAVAAVWVVNTLGLLDLLANLAHAMRVGAAEHLGAAWYGPAFVVPGMIVVHGLSFWFLLRHERGDA